jgi:hypothetical protein
MKIKTILIATLALTLIVSTLAAQDSAPPGFIITLKNGSMVRGKTLSRDETGRLRLTMTETSGRQPKSYALIAMDDAESIKASTADTDSIRIRVKGGSELKCKEFGLGADSVTVKIGTASKIEVPWDQIESISFGQ